MPGHIKHPSLYEINTRVLLKSLGDDAQLRDIPAKYWKGLQKKGIDWVWLMGIWEIQERALDPHLIPDGMMDDFRKLLPDLHDDDICGSPYAIHDYTVDTDIGDADQLRELRKQLHKIGMKLMLDFVPNHLGAHCRYLHIHPEYFIEVENESYAQDRKTFYQPHAGVERYFAHGKDPYFDAWQDTVQVNYANPDVHLWMTETLKSIAGMCDGVRCDMAMLPVRRIFQKTWGHLVPQAEFMDEFWPEPIRQVKARAPEFLFLAECYWDMEAELMEMGFDYCYDKVFYDRMTDAEPDRMRQHFHAEEWWLQRTARFLENHDEHRAAHALELPRHMATAALVACGPGMRFWHMGQWEGRRKKIPVQLHRLPQDSSCGCLLTSSSEKVVCRCIAAFYERMFRITHIPILREGEWQTIREPAAPGLIFWLWKYQKEKVIVVINYNHTDVPFFLPDMLHLLHVKHPYDLINDIETEPHQVHALAPWSVHLWKVIDL